MYQKAKTWIGLVVAILAIFMSVNFAGAAPFAIENKTYQGTTIRLCAEAVPTTEVLADLSPRFEKESGINVIFEQYPVEHLVEKQMMDLTGKTGIYDVMAVPYAQLAKYAQMGYIQSIEKFMEDPELRDPAIDTEDYIQALWKGSAWIEGKIYGFPFNPCVKILWYRKDLFEDPKEKAAFRKKYGYELDVPTNWIQYRDIAEFFTRPEENLYGIVIPAKRHKAIVEEWLCYAWSFGGEILDERGNPVINSPENVEALKYFKSLIRFCPPGTTNYTWDEVTTVEQQGLVAFSLQYNDQTPGLEDPARSKVSGKGGYAMLPVHKEAATVTGPYVWVIPKYSKHPEAAYLFIQWASSKEIDRELGRREVVPVRKSSYYDPEVKKIPYMPATLEALKVARFYPTIPEWPEMAERMALALSRAVIGEMSAQEALDWLQGEFKEILGR